MTALRGFLLEELAGQPMLVLLVASVAFLVLLSLAFAAYAFVLRLGHERMEARWRRLEDRWEEPLLGALEDPGTLPALWARVDDSYRLHFLDYVLRFARRVRGPERDVLERAAEPYLELLLPRLEHDNDAVRVRAVQTLGALGMPRHAEVILRALDDPSRLVAMVAARTLCRPEHAEHTRAVMTRLPRFREWSASFLSAMLAGIGPDAAEVLRWTLADSAQLPWVRAVAAEALWRLAEPSAADVASAVVALEADRELMAAALKLLARVGRPDHAPVVRGRAASPDFVLRAHAFTALGQLGTDDDVPLLLEGVGDLSPWVAIHAAQALRTLGAEEALEKLAGGEGPRASLALQVLDEEAGPGEML